MYQRLFQYLKTVEPPANLERQILVRVRQIAARRLIFRSGLALGSLGGTIWSIILISAKITESGFYYYFSLLISDGGLVATYWQELLLTLAESIPLLVVTVSLALLAFLFWLAPKVVEDAQMAFV